MGMVGQVDLMSGALMWRWNVRLSFPAGELAVESDIPPGELVAESVIGFEVASDITFPYRWRSPAPARPASPPANLRVPAALQASVLIITRLFSGS